MIEILFRAKPLDEKRWVYGYLLRDKITGYMIQEIDELNSFVHVQEDTIGQYTGLQDKNGTKIFEGDVVKNNIYLGVVNFSIGCYCVQTGINNPAIDLVGFDNLEVIGNIHDNQELLGEEHDAEK